MDLIASAMPLAREHSLGGAIAIGAVVAIIIILYLII
jgi:hypothetical protein